VPRAALPADRSDSGRRRCQERSDCSKECGLETGEESSLKGTRGDVTGDEGRSRLAGARSVARWWGAGLSHEREEANSPRGELRERRQERRRSDAWAAAWRKEAQGEGARGRYARVKMRRADVGGWRRATRDTTCGAVGEGPGAAGGAGPAPGRVSRIAAHPVRPTLSAPPPRPSRPRTPRRPSPRRAEANGARSERRRRASTGSRRSVPGSGARRRGPGGRRRSRAPRR